MSKITFRFSFSEVWSPKKGMNSFWGKHHNSSRVSFFIVWSTPFRGMTTLSLDFCWFLAAFEKFTIENSSTIHSFWIFWQKKSRNLMSGVWRFLNLFLNSGPVCGMKFRLSNLGSKQSHLYSAYVVSVPSQLHTTVFFITYSNTS